MAINRRALYLLQELRAQIGAQADDVVRNLTASWVKAWDVLDDAWTGAVDELVEWMAANGGAYPPPWRLARLQRLAVATSRTQATLNVLTAQAATQTAAAAAEAVALTAAAEPGVMAAQLPARAAAAAARAYATRVPPTALEAIVLRVRQQVHAAHWPLSRDAVEAMHRALVIGVAVGDNPRASARRMIRNVQGAFNGGLTRAMNLARTETLDAYRDTAAQVHTANADVLAGWVWIASLGPRCCPGCWGMHGTVHPLEEPGPLDHQQGRCARMPKVKPWRELGYDLDEPDDDVPDAMAALLALPEPDQRAVMGPRRLALLTAGQVTMADLPARRETAAWRPSYVPRSVARLEQIAARRPRG